jgi:hypothetical protein
MAHSLGVEQNYLVEGPEGMRKIYEDHYAALSFEGADAETMKRIEKLEREKDELMAQIKAVLERLGLEQIAQGK